MDDNREHHSARGMIIAAPHSGSGKTVVSLALLRALKSEGYAVAAAKAGPDYIDPVFHELSTGRPSVNLDPWAMSPERCRQLAAIQSREQDFLLVESMMGLFDGAIDGSGSGANLARALAIPVILVVDCAKQSQSVAALVRGFRDHDETVSLCGVILNRVGSERHENMLRRALHEIGVKVFGAVRQNVNLELPERHLGLVQAREINAIEAFISSAANQIARECDLKTIINSFQPLKQAAFPDDKNINGNMLPPGQHIAIARDEAFSFLYPHLLNDWRKRGAQISFFSPLAGEGPRDDSDAVFLPGGYPELHAGVLAQSNQFISAMKRARASNCLIYGECGGYMVLGEGLIDKDGAMHKMLGFLKLETSFKKRKLHLGYRIIKPINRFFAGDSLNGHEFHYTSAINQRGKPLFKVTDATGADVGEQGLISGNVMGSYMHLIDRRPENE